MKKDVKRAFCTKGIGYKKKKRGQKKFSEGLAKNACYILFGKKNIALGQIINTKYFIDGFLAKEASTLREVIERLEFYDDAFIYERADENNDVVSRDARNVGKMLVIALPNSTTDEEDDEFVQGLLSMIPDDCVKIAKMHYRSKSRQKHKHLHVLYTERSYVTGPVHEMFKYGENGSRSEFNKRVDAYIRNTLERFGYDVDSAWKFDEVKAEYVSALEKTKRVVSPRFFNEKIALELKRVDKDLRIDYDDIEQLKDIYEIAYLKNDQIAMNWYEKKIKEYYERHEVEMSAIDVEERIEEIRKLADHICNIEKNISDQADNQSHISQFDRDISQFDEFNDDAEEDEVVEEYELAYAAEEEKKEYFRNQVVEAEIQKQVSLGNEFFSSSIQQNTSINRFSRLINPKRQLAKRVDPNSQQVLRAKEAEKSFRKLKSIEMNRNNIGSDRIRDLRSAFEEAMSNSSNVEINKNKRSI